MSFATVRTWGFAAGQNQAIALSEAEWILVLNPDVRLMPDFISMMVTAGEVDSDVGSVCGKLLRMSADCESNAGAGSRFYRHLLHARAAPSRPG